MSPFKSILAATDFSAPADHAVRRAALLARQHGARLRVVHVLDRAGPRRLRECVSPPIDVDADGAEARGRLQRLAAELASRFDLTAELELRSGDVVEQLHLAAPRVDLLVIGQRRRHALSAIVLGKTAQRLVEHCRRPVLVVKQAAEGDYRRALVPIDFTPASDAAAFVAAALAPEIDLQVFHAYDTIGEAVMREADVRESVIHDSRSKEEAALLARMRRSMTRLGLDSGKMRFALSRGSPLTATLQQAQRHDADVLVATKQRRSAAATSVLGNVNGLLARSRCDMLIVSGWVRDPRRPQAATLRRPALPAAGMGQTQPAHATRAPTWTRPPVPAAPMLAAPRRRATGP